MTGPEGNSEFCFSRIAMFPETKQMDQTGGKQMITLLTTAVNIAQVTVNCFLFDVIVFAMLPAPAFGGKQFHY